MITIPCQKCGITIKKGHGKKYCLPCSWKVKSEQSRVFKIRVREKAKTNN